MENSWKFIKELNIEYDLVILFLSIYSKELEVRETLEQTNFTATLFTVAQSRNNPKVREKIKRKTKNGIYMQDILP